VIEIVLVLPLVGLLMGAIVAGLRKRTIDGQTLKTISLGPDGLSETKDDIESWKLP
jgi:hypothetical protein